MKPNLKPIVVTSFSILLMGSLFIHLSSPGRRLDHHRTVASSKQKKRCSDLLKEIAGLKGSEQEISENQYEQLYKKLFVRDHALKDYIQQHNLLEKEYQVLTKLENDLRQAADQVSGHKLSRNLSDQITDEEKQDIRNKIKGLVEDALTYVHSCRRYKLNKQNDCLSLTHDVVIGQKRTPFTRYFQRLKKKVAHYRTKMTREEAVTTEINEKVMAYKAVRLACTSQVKNQRKSTARTLFFASVISGEIAVSGSTYVVSNWDQERNQEWIMVMIQDILYQSAFGFLHASLVSLKAGLPATTVAEWMVRAARDYPSMLARSKYLAPSQEELEAKAKELMEHPHFQEQLRLLLHSLEDEALIKMVNQEIQKYENFEHQEMPESVREETIDHLSEVLAHQAYLSNAKGFIRLGDLGHDHYAFNRVWDVGASLGSVGLSIYMLKEICMNQKYSMTMKAVSAAALYSLAKLSLNTSYQVLEQQQFGE